MDTSNKNRFNRILILTQYFKPETGAPQIRLSAMVKELRKNGIDVEVITTFPNYPFGVIHENYRGKFYTREVIDGVVLKRIWSYTASGKNVLKRLLSYISFMITSCIPLLFSKRPDLVFVEAQPIILAFPALLMKIFRGVPFIYNTPDLQIEFAEDEKWIANHYLIKLAKLLESFLMKKSLSVTTVTNAFIRHFSKYRNIKMSKITLLPNGADVDILHPMPRDALLAKRLEVGERKVITYAGTHAHYQGLETIIRTAEILMNRQDIVFLMIGNGPIREKLKYQANKKKLTNVLFRQSPFEEMAKLMSITYASLVVLRDMPISRKMRLSKAIPPLSCGVPVIYAGYGETPEILLENNAGIQVEPESPNKLATAITDIVDNPDFRNTLSINSRELALQQFSWEKIVNDWLVQVNNIVE